MSSLNNTLIKVYNNLFSFFEYRDLICLSDKLNDDDFVMYIYNNDFIVLNTIKSKYVPDGDIKNVKNNINNSKYDNSKTKYKITFIVLFYHSTSVHLKTQDFKKIVGNLSNTNMLYDIIFITKDDLNTHIGNFIKDTNGKAFDQKVECLYEHEERFCNCNKLNLYTYTYNNFIIIIPNHILVPKYNVLDKEEEIDLLNTINIKKINLPKIKRSDPMVIWSKAIAGNIIKVYRTDDVAGNSIYYRIVV